MKNNLHILPLFLAAVFVLLSVTSVSAYSGASSFEYRYPDAFETAVKNYPSFARLLREELSGVPVPGNILSDAFSGENGAGTTENMVAQGLCVTEEHILVTAYDSAGEYDSVIYVLSNAEEHALLSTVIMPDKNHSGGIASDGETIWIAKSGDGVAAVPYGVIREAAASGGIYRLPAYGYTAPTEEAASFLTYYGGVLWVGTFREKEKSLLSAYAPEGSTLTPLGRHYTLPKKAQGATFFEKDGAEYLFVSCSYGRKNTSDVYVFGVGDRLRRINKYAFPPMTEETQYYNGCIYLIYESSATEYSARESRCPVPVDRITALGTEDMTERDGAFLRDIPVRLRDLLKKLADYILPSC